MSETKTLSSKLSKAINKEIKNIQNSRPQSTEVSLAIDVIKDNFLFSDEDLEEMRISAEDESLTKEGLMEVLFANFKEAKEFETFFKSVLDDDAGEEARNDFIGYVSKYGFNDINECINKVDYEMASGCFRKAWKEAFASDLWAMIIIHLDSYDLKNSSYMHKSWAPYFDKYCCKWDIEHDFNIEIKHEYRRQLEALGYKYKRRHSTHYLERGRFIDTSNLWGWEVDTYRLSHRVPEMWYQIHENWEEEALALLGLKSEWVESYSVDG